MFKIEINGIEFSVTATELEKIRAKGVKPAFVL